MSLTPEESTTLQTYDDASKTWKESHNTNNFWHAEMQQLASRLSGDLILDVGSGAGRDIKELSNLGLTVDALEPSVGLLELSKTRNPHTTFYNATIYNAPKYIKHTYDGIWCAAVFLHIPKARTKEALLAIRSILKTEGYAFISLKQGTGEGLEPFAYGGEGLMRLMTYWQKDDFAKALIGAGLEPVYYSELKERHNVWMSFISKAV